MPKLSTPTNNCSINLAEFLYVAPECYSPKIGLEPIFELKVLFFCYGTKKESENLLRKMQEITATVILVKSQ